MGRHRNPLWCSRSVWILFVTCVLTGACAELSPGDEEARQFVFRDRRQEEFASSLGGFTFTIPSRVDADGQFLTNHLHAKHVVVRRSVPSYHGDTGGSGNASRSRVTAPAGEDGRRTESVDSDSSSGQRVSVHYRIPIENGKEVVVQVYKNSKLLSPDAVVERKGNKFRNASDSEFSPLHRWTGCHFSGTVLGDSNSRVALAACDGLTGFFHTGGQQYLIEPVKGHQRGEDDEHPHIVYKRSALPAHLQPEKHPTSKDDFCGVNEDVEHVIRKRERWERHRRNQERKKRMAEEVEKGRGGNRRKKRSISSEKNVETLVVVDPDMMRYYQNEDIENYVLTVMNMVATLFHDASIGNAVNIVIVRLLLLKDLDEDLEITHHADNTLHSFCKWQKSVNFRDDDHPNHHDVALLLTRRNICNRMNQPCGTLGLAQVSGMCQPHRSCSINEDTGLSLAWTVTHELGHNFDMKHDNNYNCKSAPNDTYVMAAQLSWDKSPSHWSDCSRASITKFLDRDWGFCLDDEPGHHDFQYPVLPAGTMYDADHQCRILYGQDAALCNGIEVLENICSTLWCRVNNKCSTKLQPAAEGTICGTNRWCFAGNCVEIGDRPHAINGEWGEWAEWTSCSRTCGAGVSHSERHCNHPPPSNGGKYCIGERKRYRICNTDECPDDGLSFRHAQCLEFNEIPYKGNKYDWIPVPTPDTPCQLHCKPKDMFFSVLLKDIATDGTSCVSGSRHMCISGRCRHVGCDWEIDSSATEDRCGVCYGDGSTCTTVKKQFNETKAQGYVQATVIPKDARNIRVEEIADASNFLALRNEKGEYYLNGHWFIQWSGDYEIAGTVVRYHRQGNKESFQAQGPLKEPLHIMLLMQAHNPGVEYEYTVPKQNATDSRQPEFRWEYTDWSHCTLSCGGGYQLSEVICVEKEAGQVDEKYCDASTKSDDKQRSCNEHICPARWWTGPWQHCSVTCGEDGTHKRTVICVRSLGQDEQIALEDSACQGMKRPMGVEPCRSKDPCPGVVPEWVVGNWSTCNGNPCAKQTRAVLCSDVTLGCSPFTRPTSSQPCSNVTCGTWQTEEWSGCTRTCNGGVQYRKVSCTGEVCDLELKPPEQQPCGMAACPEASAGNTSGHGVESGSPVTSQGPNRTTQPLPEELQTVLLSNTSIHLNLGPVKEGGATDLTLSNSTSISQENNEIGLIQNDHANADPSPANPSDVEEKTQRDQRNRSQSKGKPEKVENEVEGVNKAESIQEAASEGLGHVKADEMLNGLLNPVEGGAEEDNSVNTGKRLGAGKVDNEEEDPEELGRESLESDAFQWYAGEWRPCSSPCGGGVQTRTVSCLRVSTGARMDRDFCSIMGKPNAIQECSPHNCTDWGVTEWSQCSALCGYATRVRNVTCPEKDLCDPKVKPHDVDICQLEPCTAWVTGGWSKCSKTCDGGSQERLVQCVNMTSQLLSMECDEKVKPDERQGCNIDECPKLDNAFSVTCESNEMSFKVCRMLRKLGLCHKDYVQAKCCRTCADHSRQAPEVRKASRR